MLFDILRVALQHHFWGSQLERPMMRAVCFFRAVSNAAALEDDNVLISRRVRVRGVSKSQHGIRRVGVEQRSLEHSHETLIPSFEKYPNKGMLLHRGNGGSGQQLSVGLEHLQPLHVTKNVANSKKKRKIKQKE